MNNEYIRRRQIADLSQEFASITNGMFEIIKYKEKRPSDGRDVLIASIPLQEHPLYGETKIHIMEFYDSNGELEYHYGWEKNDGSKQTKHISAWGNEPHTGHRKVENTEPFHHHHIPGNLAERKDCYHIRNLRDVLEFVEEFIIYKQEYSQDINT